jgi:hypothetical protein
MELSMDEKDFREIDREMEKRLIVENDLIWGYDRWEENQKYPKIAAHSQPLQYEWIPVGEYNGVDLSDIMIDENYIVWQQVLNSEYNCEVILQ